MDMSTAREIHVGSPADNFRLGESVTVHFHGFESLTTVKGEPVYSPTFSCAGNDWCLQVYPGGDNDAADGMVSVFLKNQSPAKIPVTFQIALVTSRDGVYQFGNQAKYQFDCAPSIRYGSWGWKNFCHRNTIANGSNNFLNEGTLSFVVRIIPNRKIVEQSNLSEDIIKLYGEDDTGDVAFSVADRVFYGHRLILKVRAPEFFQLTEQFDSKTPMPINDMKPEVFEMMLKHLYGKNISFAEWKEYSKQILVASNKYGFSDLNLEAEAQYMLFMSLTGESAVNELLYADGSHCYDLKKAVIEYIVKNGEAVMASSSFPKLSESPKLMTEVMAEFVKYNKT